MPKDVKRKYPVGAEIIPGNGVHFRLWAPDRREVYLIVESENEVLDSIPMVREDGGYFSLWAPNLTEKSLYRFSFGSHEARYPDPASRFQPSGPKGPSMVINSHFAWTDADWRGITLKGQVIYEMHIGTYTEEGTFGAAAKRLPELAALGITAIEIMPVHDFPGSFGWGYDGVNLFAPCRLYGAPDDLKRFVDQAHRLGIGVILDVVYNHFGHEDNYLSEYAREYFNPAVKTAWGDSINFASFSVREFFIANAKYWIEEFHMDGLRLDATSCIFCDKEEHILAEIAKAAKKAAGKKEIALIAESESQDTRLLRPYDEGGFGFDALWNDDFHHAAKVRLTGRREFFFRDYLGAPQEFISSLKHGFLYQGQASSWKEEAKGTPSLAFSPQTMVIFLENHDQVGNTGLSERISQGTDFGNLKALTALLLLSPNTPMLFQGQEFGSKKPFYYFADHSEALNPLVDKGRREFLSRFPRIATQEGQENICSPSLPQTFMKSKLDHGELEKDMPLYRMHKELIRLRKVDAVFRNMQEKPFDGAVIGQDSFLIRYFGEDEDRLLIVNFGVDFELDPPSDPLLAPGLGKSWEILFSTESVSYGGHGTPPLTSPFWTILGRSAVLLKNVLSAD